MAQFVDLMGTDGIQEGQMTGVTVEGKSVLVAKTGGQFYAASNICPHLRGRLSHGRLNGTIVTCPRHGSRFDLKNGRVVRWTNWSGPLLAVSKIFRSPRPLTVYKTRVEEGRVKISFGD